MMFALTESTAKLANLNIRPEFHGEDTKLAVDIKIEIKGANTILNELEPGLLNVLYRKSEDGEEEQGELDLDPTRLPKLRFPLLAQPIKWEKEFTGYQFVIHYGISEDSNVVLTSCAIDSFKFDCQDGGTVGTTFRIIVHPEPGQLEKLSEMIQQTITLSLIPPTEDYLTQASIDNDTEE